MRARDKEWKSVISMLIANVKKAAIDAGTREEIPDELVDVVILTSKKTVKERPDSCPDERAELKAEYRYNYGVICEYAPKMMRHEEIQTLLEADSADVVAAKTRDRS